MSTAFKIEPCQRVTYQGRELGVFTEFELLALRDELDRLFGLDRLLSREGFEVHTVIEAFCEITGVTWVALKGRTKTEPLLFHRQMCMEIVRQLCPKASSAVIARAFGDRERSSVSHTQNAVEERCRANVQERKRFEELRTAVIAHVQKTAAPAPEKIVTLS